LEERPAIPATRLIKRTADVSPSPWRAALRAEPFTTQDVDFPKVRHFGAKINILITKNLQFINGLSPTNCQASASAEITEDKTADKKADKSTRQVRRRGHGGEHGHIAAEPEDVALLAGRSLALAAEDLSESLDCVGRVHFLGRV